MQAPCGHSGAVCVFGNYWECSICDAPAEATTEAPEVAIKAPKVGKPIWGTSIAENLMKSVIPVQPMPAPVSALFDLGDTEPALDMKSEKDLKKKAWKAALEYMTGTGLKDGWDQFRTYTEARDKAVERYRATGSTDPFPDTPPAPIYGKKPTTHCSGDSDCLLCEAMQAPDAGVNDRDAQMTPSERVEFEFSVMRPKGKKLKAGWKAEPAEDLRALQGLDVEGELAATMRVAILEGRVKALGDSLEAAWGIISNSSNWDDGKGSPGWRGAAEKWRNTYFDLSSETVTGSCANCGRKEPMPIGLDWCHVCIETDIKVQSLSGRAEDIAYYRERVEETKGSSTHVLMEKMLRLLEDTQRVHRDIEEFEPKITFAPGAFWDPKRAD